VYKTVSIRHEKYDIDPNFSPEVLIKRASHGHGHQTDKEIDGARCKRFLYSLCAVFDPHNTPAAVFLYQLDRYHAANAAP